MKHLKIGIGVLIASSLAYFFLYGKESDQHIANESESAHAQATPVGSTGSSQAPSIQTKATEGKPAPSKAVPTEHEQTNQTSDTSSDLVKSYPNHFVGDLAAFATDQRYLEAVGDLENLMFNLPSDWSDDSAKKVEQIFKESGRKFVNSDTKCNARLCVTTGEVYDEEDFWKIYESLPESTGMAKWGMAYSLTKNDLGNTVFAMYKYRSEEDYTKKQ